MKAVVVYESMFGNTHLVAEHIRDGLAESVDAVVLPLSQAGHTALEGVDLVVVGGPTHAHGMTSEGSRSSAVEQAAKKDELDLDEDAPGPGLREWLAALEAPATGGAVRGAAFDTRVHGPAALTGRASKKIAKQLKHHGLSLVADPESFLVDRDNHLIEGEADRAHAWGSSLAGALTAAAST
jgi:hypothetical protein